MIAYIEYFGFARLVVNLSSDYAGIGISEIYAIDPTTGQEIDLDIDLNLSDEEIVKVLENDAVPSDKYAKALKHAMQIAMSRKFELEINRVLDEAAKYAFETL